MKKLVNLSFVYAILALCAGVFYREFTKLSGFTGNTTLSVVHTHLFVLGMVMLLIAVILCKQFALNESKKFGLFIWLYNIGLVVSTIMMIVRGITQVLSIDLSKALNASISGISGIGHMLIGAGIIVFFLALKDKVKEA